MHVFLTARLSPPVLYALIGVLWGFDAAQKIERVLKEKGLPVVFNRFDRRYETGTRRDSSRSAVRVVRAHIYLDTLDRLSQIEVRNIYTWF